MIKKYTNGFMIAGILMLFVTFIIMLFPWVLTDKNPYTTNTLDSYTDSSGAFVFRTAPFEPDEDYVLGTDDSGRDVLSFILYGTRLTLSVALSVTLLRFLFALIFGIGAGYERTASKVVIEQFNNVFNGIPPVLLCILVLSIPYFKTFSKSASTMVFIVVLTLVEWARTGEVVRDRVIRIRQKDFIKSEIAIGRHPLQIIFSNILPHLLPEMTVMFFMEIARVLTVLMQLGIFNVYIGNLRIVASTDQGVLVGKATSYEPEWSSMLGAAKNTIRSAPWIVFSSAAAFFFVVLGFNLLGEGIRRKLKQMKVLQFSKRETTVGAIVFLVLIAVITMPMVTSGAAYHDFSMSRIPSVAFDQEAALPGNESHRTYLVNRLTTLGIDPVPALETYDQPYESLRYHWIEAIDGEIGNTVIEGIVPYTYQSFEGTGYVYDARQSDLTSLSNTERAKINHKFVIINPELYDEAYWLNFSEKVLQETNALGIIVLEDEASQYSRLGTRVEDGVIIGMPKKYERALMKERMHLTVKSQQEEAVLTNVVGYIQGNPDINEPEAMILGFDLNYEDSEEGTRRFNFVMNFLQALKANEGRLTKSVILIFWDGSQLEDNGGKGVYWERYYYQIKNSECYLDLTHLDFSQGLNGEVTIDKHLISDAKPVAANFTNLLVENIENISGHPDSFLARRTKEPFYYKWGIPTVYLNYQTSETKNDGISVEDFGNLLIESLVFELY
ncbi:ABC transporter permease [Fusibacter paucivorans]|uniref:ABC transporter permease n=1 Tax=Fusibacter paucivorans TaxID=76009 RepID=A0ABS5PN35_9FIRM|nr:ABC transporter permease [Fusibacter paucivorans]